MAFAWTPYLNWVDQIILQIEVAIILQNVLRQCEKVSPSQISGGKRGASKRCGLFILSNFPCYKGNWQTVDQWQSSLSIIPDILQRSLRPTPLLIESFEIITLFECDSNRLWDYTTTTTGKKPSFEYWSNKQKRNLTLHNGLVMHSVQLRKKDENIQPLGYAYTRWNMQIQTNRLYKSTLLDL